MRAQYRGLRVARERKLANFDLPPRFARLRLCHPNAGDLRLSVSAAGNEIGVERLGRFARDLRYGDDALHAADMGELRKPGNDVADGVNAGLGGLHPLISLDDAALLLRACPFQSTASG